jgi:hypothetical protein
VASLAHSTRSTTTPCGSSGCADALGAQMHKASTTASRVADKVEAIIAEDDD